MSFSSLKQRFRIIFLAVMLAYGFAFCIYVFYLGINPEAKDIFGFLPSTKLYNPPPKNYVTKWEHDIVSLKEKLPAGQTRLGYLADWDIYPDPSPDQYVFYYLTQYSLAPLWIDRGIKNEWIILYTSQEKPKAWLDAHLKSYTIQPAGFRFFLIHQTTSK